MIDLIINNRKQQDSCNKMDDSDVSELSHEDLSCKYEQNFTK